MLDKIVLQKFLDCSRYEDFLSWYYGEFGESSLLRETPYLPDENDERWLIPGKYYVIQKKKIVWDKENKTYIYGKWEDKEDRHTKIYRTGIILRRLNPEASVNDLLREIVSILLTYYSLKNSDGTLKFTKDYILQTLESVMKADLDVKMKDAKHSSFKANEAYCKKNGVSKRTVVNRILSEQNTERKEEKYNDIDCFYDPKVRWENGKKITQEQWLGILKENGIEITLRSFQRYLELRGYSKPRKRTKSLKNDITKHNIIHNTIILGNVVFSDTDDAFNETCISSNRKFLEVVEKIHRNDEFITKWRA
jgi:hypothetical protein